MTRIITTIQSLVLLWVVGSGVAWAAKSKFDVVTMANGDIHNGTVALERFRLQTSFGVVSIPYGRMKHFIRGKQGGSDRIVTQSGDHFSGQILDQSLYVLRVLDPFLPLDLEDISEISFANRQLGKPSGNASDLVITNDGDTFAAQVLTSDFLVMGKQGIKMVNRDTVNYLDVSLQEESDENLVQVTQNSGTVIQGRISTETVTVRLEHHETHEIGVQHLSAIALRVNHSGRRSDYLYRQRFNPFDLVQDQMRDGSLGPKLLAVRGGQTIRGDIQGDGDTDEQPPQKVTLKPFAIGLHEVTFEEYDQYCEATGQHKPEDQGWGRGQRPVINVTWEEAVAYTEWLSQRTGKNYRLPTDAEWEYTARAGSNSKFWWGNEVDHARANCEGCGSLWDGEKTSPVGRFAPNPFGLHDTAGNVFEWVADCWHDKFSEAPADGSALDTAGCGKRVIRGGAWSFPPHEIRSANRWRDFPSRSSDDTGFRVARDL